MRTKLRTSSQSFVVDEIFPTKQKKKYTNVDVLSYIGGMLGLLSGFSLLSLVEIVYIFIIKPVAKLFKRNKIHPDHNDSRRKRFVETYLSKSSIHSFYYIANELKITDK